MVEGVVIGEGGTLDQVAAVHQEGIHIGLALLLHEGGHTGEARVMGAGSGVVSGVIRGVSLAVDVGSGHQIDFHMEEPVDHGGKLTAGGQAQGLQGVVAHAPDEAHGHGPGHGIFCIGEDLPRISKAAEIGGLGHVLAGKLGVPVEHGDHFLPGDVLQGTEGLISVAFHDAFTGSPGHGVFVVGVGDDVGEARGGGHFGGTSHAVQDGGHHGPAQRLVGGKQTAADTVHVSLPVHVLNGYIEEPVLRHIGVRHIRDGDAALAVGVGIGLAHDSLQVVADVGNEDLIVNHGLVLQDLIVHKHVDAVAAGLQHVVVGGQCVGFLQVNGLIFPRLVQDLDVLYPAQALYRDEHTLVVHLDRGGDVQVDGVL